jgi:hypothetical protein
MSPLMVAAPRYIGAILEMNCDVYKLLACHLHSELKHMLCECECECELT